MRIPDKFAGLLLEALRPREREVLGLHFLDQFEVGEIGHLLRLKPDSVSGHITKGLIAIAKIIDSRPDDARRLLENMGESFARSAQEAVGGKAERDEATHYGSRG